MMGTISSGKAINMLDAEDDLLQGASNAGRSSLMEPEAKQLLARFGITVPAGCTVNPSSDADLSAVSALRPPLVVKIVSAKVLHKSDGGGVMLHLKDGPAVADAIDSIASRYRNVPVDAYLVEEMAPPGVELVIGGIVDESFGPAILVGIGGVLIEMLNDVAMRLCPISRNDAHEMLASLRGAALLRGVRGSPPIDRDAVIDAMLAIGSADGLLMRHHASIDSIDVNPLIASSKGCVAADVRVLLHRGDKRSIAAPKLPKRAGNLRQLLSPRSIVVVGASTEGTGPGNTFIRNLRGFGYDGTLAIVHPTARSIDGVPCYTSLGALPEAVDYAYVAIPAARVPALLASAAGKVAFAQVMSSGFAEIAGGEQLQIDLLNGARRGGVRVVGPNCLGLHSTRARVTFIDRAIDSAGHFGVISQSGGMGVDMLRRGQAHGVRFSYLVTIGNAADVSVIELVDELLNDDETKVIGLYLESMPDGRALFNMLRERMATRSLSKPIILLKGGRSLQGQRAAQSHTGAMASNERLLLGLAQQTGIVLVDTLDEFIDVALAFQLLKPNYVRPLQEVCLFGNGGGTSVIACDIFAQHGLTVSPLSSDVIAELEALHLPPGASVINPIDTPAGVLNKDNGAIAEAILAIIYRAERVDAIVLHLNLTVIVGYYAESLLSNLIDAAMRARDDARRDVPFLLVLRSDGSEAIDAIRRNVRSDAIARGIPVYNEMPQVAQVLAAIAWNERRSVASLTNKLA